MMRGVRIAWLYLAHLVAGGILAAILFAPLFVKGHAGSQLNACINNLRQIDSGKAQWALAQKKDDSDPIVIAEVNQYLKGNTAPECPGGGRYLYGRMGADPRCTWHGGQGEFMAWLERTRGGGQSRRIDCAKIATFLVRLSVPVMLLILIPITIVRYGGRPSPAAPPRPPTPVLIALFIVAVAILAKMSTAVYPDLWTSQLRHCQHVMNWIDARKEDHVLAWNAGLSAAGTTRPAGARSYSGLLATLKADRDLVCLKGGKYTFGLAVFNRPKT